MPALPSCILKPLWDQFAALLPQRTDTHPLGCTAPASPTAPSSTSSSKSWSSAAATAASKTPPARPPRCAAAGMSDRARAGRAAAPAGLGRLRPHARPPAGRSGRRRLQHQGPLRWPDGRSQPGGPRQTGPQTLGRHRGRRHPAGRGASPRQPPRLPAAGIHPGQDPATLDKLGPLPEEVTVPLDAGYDGGKTASRWPSATLPARSPTKARTHARTPARSRPPSAGRWSAPTPGATTSASCAGAPSAIPQSWSSGSCWPTRSSPWAGWSARPGPATAGRPACAAAPDPPSRGGTPIRA